VRKDCGARPVCFTSIGVAVEAAENAPADKLVRIEVGPGDFRERVVVRRSNVTLSGAGREKTRLHNSLAAEHAGKFYAGNWGTPGSATLTVNADRVTLRNMTVENDFDYLANDGLADDDPRKIANSQALAVLLDTHSDRVLIEQVALLGYQDTLFAHGGRAHVRNSLVAGNIDFIFGNGKLFIEDSELRSRPRARRDEGPFESFILAPSTQLSQQVGLVVYKSRLTRESGVRDGSVALARPWHPTTKFDDGRYADPNAVGQALFIDCYMDAHIHPDHWASMPGTARDGTKTHIFYPQDSRFWEAGSYGPGARYKDIGISWKPTLSVEQIRQIVLGDWNASTR
jgi:pectinesterase